ncbi:MAG: TonB-dependent receptor [Bacteroidetes bacterium]|nr:TonB-dependent receptor [Bacteroidota bacterium]
MVRPILETEQKALEINLDEPIYGAFAEIGAGQEVARHFFQVGAAAGTIAKSMSAYDKIVSDDIYGPELLGKGRYVCESRLYKMLDHEYDLMEARLRVRHPDRTFFAFADTVAAINYTKTIKGDGWLGLRFQLKPDSGPNDLILHVRMLDQDNRLQQQAVGILGVNMVYGCYRYYQDPETLLKSLMDNLRGRVMIDMVRIVGPDFQWVDNRMICLWMVKNELSTVAIFGPDGNSMHAGEFLYKKSILIARGSYRPPTLVQEDMIQHSFAQFRNEPDVIPGNAYFLTEITLDNLTSDGALDERDFMDRAQLLCGLNQTVVISNCIKHKDLIGYFSDYKVQSIGLAMGVRKLQTIITETWTQNPDHILSAFGELFLKNVRFYVYPALDEQTGVILTSRTIEIPMAIRFLYEHLLENRNIVDIATYDPKTLRIHHKEILHMIQQGQTDWEKYVPEEVAHLIRLKRLFVR